MQNIICYHININIERKECVELNFQYGQGHWCIGVRLKSAIPQI